MKKEKLEVQKNIERMNNQARMELEEQVLYVNLYL